jgi:hypothetical protein
MSETSPVIDAHVLNKAKFHLSGKCTSTTYPSISSFSWRVSHMIKSLRHPRKKFRWLRPAIAFLKSSSSAISRLNKEHWIQHSRWWIADTVSQWELQEPRLKLPFGHTTESTTVTSTVTWMGADDAFTVWSTHQVSASLISLRLETTESEAGSDSEI